MDAMGELRKYPKTFHLPWSPGLQNDDRVIPSLASFEAMNEVVVTEKLDGENTTIYQHHIHARSMDGNHHDSRNWVKALWGGLRWMIPENVRICGENMYAAHSIRYTELSTYFYVFGIFEEDVCWSWDKTVSFCQSIGVETVPVLYRGPWNPKLINSTCMGDHSRFGGEQEGYVIRNAAEFKFGDFQNNVVKYVRSNHVQTDEHWAKNWIPNKLKK
jgi:hypothetical protein